MKTLSQIEAWVVRLADAVSRGVRPEDDRVELKADWPADYNKAARRIAAIANQASADEVLWVVGLDEKKGNQPLSSKDYGQWWAQVKAEFEGVPPDVQGRLVPLPNGGEVFALLFDTRGLPFVVKNASGGPITYDVPWRDGTLTRSAKRAELLRILSPAIERPEVTVLNARLAFPMQTTASNPPEPQRITYSGRLEASLYITPRSSDRVVIPRHLCSIVVEPSDSAMPHSPGQLRLYVMQVPVRNGERRSAAPMITHSDNELLIDGPGRVELYAEFSEVPEASVSAPTLRVVLALAPVDARATVEVPIEFRPPKDAQPTGKGAMWELVRA